MLDIALKNGISRSVYRYRLKVGWSEERAATEPIRKRKRKGYQGEIAIYRNDEIVAMGTEKECAEEMNVSIEYIRWLMTPTGIKRQSNRKNPNLATMAVKIDE